MAETASGCTACGYETASGRPFFLGRDPIEEKGGRNLYNFCSNDPVHKWDMLGMQEIRDASQPADPTMDEPPPHESLLAASDNDPSPTTKPKKPKKPKEKPNPDNPTPAPGNPNPEENTDPETPEEEVAPNRAAASQSGQVVVFVVDGAGGNIFDHTGVAVRGSEGKLVYYDVQAESKSNPRPDGSVNKYSLEEFRKTYGDRNPRYTVVDVPNINRVKDALEFTNYRWAAGDYGYEKWNRNCTGFVCDVLYRGGYEVKRIPGDGGENPWRYPNDLEQSLRYFNSQSTSSVRKP